jgi:general secretion pathway protein G
MKTSRFSAGFRRAFTLVELLVVVAIVAILAALLLPAISRMGDNAKTAQSASNLRQLGAAAILFAGDNNGSLPSPREDWNGDGKMDDGDFFPAQLIAFMGLNGINNSTYLTPAILYGAGPFQSPLRGTRFGDPEWQRNGYSYGISSFLLHPEWDRRLARVPEPGKTILFGDKVSTGEENDPNGDAGYLGSSDLRYVRPWNPATIGSGIWGSGSPAYRHQKRTKAQMVFVDGHVGLHTKEELLLQPPSGRSLWQWWE